MAIATIGRTPATTRQQSLPLTARGSETQQPLVAYAGAGGGTGERWGEGISGLRAKSLRPIGWADDLPSPSGLRTYPRAPIALSLVDSVVFGRDIDLSGDSYFDNGFKELFRDCAGTASWDRENAGGRGLRTYESCPGQQSLFSQVVFGRGTGGSVAGGCRPSAPVGEAQELSEDFTFMFPPSYAGRASWAKTSPRGLNRAATPPGGRQRQTPADVAAGLRIQSPRVPPQRPSASPRRGGRSGPGGRVLVSRGQSVVLNTARTH
mmetsp:Transcript_104834/g.291977  ORF Transcript_104834/g.291977 Transcript_104834/m.291977 type:complete len:264 (+) Transcript_104834:47-838(+)